MHIVTQVRFQRRLAKLGRFSWTLHNLVGHPLSEVLYLVGLHQASNFVHEVTIPIHVPGTGRG